ncbi:MAG: Holliday junction branch migration protein RuvA, partial [Oscillospiraceae bacterium]|nr:Holliday junction branch migration protein RuvA [Oscillospiraceae bacterium]
MFYYLDGNVAHIEPYLAVIDCGGVGYACKTTNTTLGQIKKGERARLYTYLNVGEDVFDLYGFATQSELGSFRQLLGISGVGPKAALAILSSTTP